VNPAAGLAGFGVFDDARHDVDDGARVLASSRRRDLFAL
jgi:hypothetical protein